MTSPGSDQPSDGPIASSDVPERLAALDDTPTHEHLDAYTAIADDLAARLDDSGAEHRPADGSAGG